MPSQHPPRLPPLAHRHPAQHRRLQLEHGRGVEAQAVGMGAVPVA